MARAAAIPTVAKKRNSRVSIMVMIGVGDNTAEQLMATWARVVVPVQCAVPSESSLSRGASGPKYSGPSAAMSTLRPLSCTTSV